ncbi:MAG TPA: hypothetical protein VI815_02965 [Candidatus Nanoarchaeia archaeon]|nr:hypothetical protein [Candidatus Nanoarchaeia archaeon]
MSANQERKLRMIVEFHGNASNAMKAVDDFERKFGSTFKQLGVNVEVELRKTERRIKQSFDRMSSYGKRFSKQMSGGAFLGGSSGGIGKEFDSFEISQGEMRGSTTGLRHEVGKLRNTLLLVSFATTAVVSAFKTMFQTVLQNESAMIGLKAVAISTGLSFDRLRESSVILENSGIMSITGSSAAQKNLAATKMTLMEVQGVMGALTDAAAFNRQGTLSMEEAVVGATQGIKNQNSIMIDNAGITKNVSIMYKEYAASIGKTIGALTEHEKRQAMVSGIMQEAELFAGNAEKSMFSYQGRLNKLNVEILKTSRNLGDMAAPNIMAGLEALTGGLSKAGNDEGFMKLTALLTSYFKELMIILPKIADNFMAIPRFLSPLSSIFDNSIVKMTLMSGLLLKMNSYAQGFLIKFKQGQLQGVIDNSSKRLASSAILATDKGLNQESNAKKTIIQSAQFEAKMKGKIIELEKTGNLNDLIQKNAQKEINLLLASEGAQLEKNIKYKQLINDLTIRGFNIYKTNSEVKVGKNTISTGSFLVRDANANLSKDSLFNKKGASPTLVAEASSGAGAYNIAGLLGKIGIQKQWFKDIATSAKISMASMKADLLSGKLTLESLKLGFGTAGTAALAFGKSVMAMGMTIMAVFGQFMMYYTIVMTLIDLFKQLVGASNEEAKKREQRLTDIDIEIKALTGLSRSYDLLINKVTSLNQAFGNGSGYENFYTAQGNTIQETEIKMKSLLTDMDDIKFEMQRMAHSGKDSAINPLTGIEMSYDEFKNYLDNLKTQFSELNTYANDAYDNISGTLTDAGEFFASAGGKINSTIGNAANQVSSFNDNIIKWASQYPILNEKIGDDVVTTLLGISKDASYYDALMLSNTKSFELEKRKYIIDSEKQITEIKKNALNERTKGIFNSQSKEMALLVTASKEQLDAIRDQQRALKLELEGQKFATGDAILSMGISSRTSISAGHTSARNIDTYIEGILAEADNQSKRYDRLLKNIIAADVKARNTSRSTGQYQLMNLDKGKSAIENKDNKFYDSYKSLVNLNKERLLNEQDLANFWTKNKESIMQGDFDASMLETVLNTFNQSRANVSKALNKLVVPDEVNNLDFKKFKESLDKLLKEGGQAYEELSRALLSGSTKKLTEERVKEAKSFMGSVQQALSNKIGALESQAKAVEDTLPKQYANALIQIRDTTEATSTLNSKIATLSQTILTNSEYVNNHNQAITDLKNKYNVINDVLDFNHKLTMDGIADQAYADAYIKQHGLALYNLHVKNAKDAYEAKKEFNDKMLKNEIETARTNEFIQLRNSADIMKMQNEKSSKALGLGLSSTQATELEAYGDAWINFSGKLAQAWFMQDQASANEASRNLVELAKQKFNALKNITNDLVNQTNIQSIGSGSIIETMFGLDAQGMAQIDLKYNALIANASSYYMNYAQIIQYAAQKEQELVQKRMTDISNFAGNMIQAAYSFGAQIGQAFVEVNQGFDKEKADMLKEQETLLLRGEISQAQYLDRTTQLHSYYAERTRNVWTQAFNSIGKGMTQTIADIVTELGKNAAEKAVKELTANASIGTTLLTGLTSALPYAGIGLALGFIGDAIFGSNKEPEMPDFTQTNANQLSKFGGTIKAEEVKIEISPTFIIEGQQVFIGSGSIVEFVDESTELLKKAVQQAIDNKEFDLSLARG